MFLKKIKKVSLFIKELAKKLREKFSKEIDFIIFYESIIKEKIIQILI